MRLRVISSASFMFMVTLAASLRGQGPAQTKPLDRANLDTTCLACDDFYQFANGSWLKLAKIPAAYPEFGSFQELFDQNEAVLHDILTTSLGRVKSGQYKPGTGEWKVGAFYATCMDTTAVEKLGWTPLKPELDRIAAINSADDLKRSFGELEKREGLAPWVDGSAQDARDAANTITGLYQGGLSLPNSEYYTKTDTASANFRGKFTGIVAHMFVLLGDSPSRAADEAPVLYDSG